MEAVFEVLGVSLEAGFAAVLDVSFATGFGVALGVVGFWEGFSLLGLLARLPSLSSSSNLRTGLLGLADEEGAVEDEEEEEDESPDPLVALTGS